LPQLVRPACFVAGLSSLWAWGDFALSRVIAERDVTLGMTIQSLMSGYRLEIATFLVWILLFGGAATFFLFEGAGRVFGQKSSG
jgi:thiamine transport system permease protein